MNDQLDKIIDFCFRGDVSWTIDQLEGTSYYNSAMAEIEENKKKAKAKLQRLMVEARLKAKLGMIEYYDQAPTNESCNWKGLLSDNRKQIEYELSQLTKELEDE